MSLPIFSPSAYMMFQGIIGSNRARRLCIEEYVKPLPGKRILDVGCGPAYVAGLMEGATYIGLDTDRRRIEYAKRIYGDRGTFYCQELDDSAVRRFKPFDVTIMLGLLHHLDDKALLDLLRRVKRLLVPGGKVVTLDGCYTPGQSFITKKLLDEDQGRHVRTKEQYVSLASQVFNSVGTHVHNDLAFIPYTYIIMELSCDKDNPERGPGMKRALSKNAKTKVLFINPNIKKETQHPILNSVVFSSPPLGLSYVVACLRKKHPDVHMKVFDEIATPISDAEIGREAGDTGQPVIVGISALTATYSRTIEIARKIKESNPDAVVVFGGVHATALPEEVLMTGYADIVVRNEGEVTMTEIYEALSEGKSIAGIQGISYRDGGRVVHNQSRGITDLSTLPEFPYDLYEQNIRQYSDFGYLLTSRGCPYDCIFCSNRLVTGMRYRTFTIEYIMDQLETLIEKYKQRHILFGDDTIISDKKRFFHLMENIVKKDFHKKARFTAQLRGEDMTEDVLDCMKKANFNAISCGIETSSERLLKLIQKKESIAEIKRGVALASSKGFSTGSTFIFGLPTETKNERAASSRMSRALPLDNVRFNIAVPYPGTKLFEIAKKEGTLHITPEWRNFNVQYYLFGDDIPYVPAGTGKYALMFETMLANARFYLRPRILLNSLFKASHTGGVVISLENRRKKLNFYFNVLAIMSLIARRFIYVGFRALGERNEK